MKTLLQFLLASLVLASTAAAQTHIDPDWVFRWAWSPTESDQGDAIVADQAGNVYVTGHTDTTASYDDFVTIKVDINGDSVWSRIYDSPGDGIDDPEFIGMDADGYIYVAGDVGRSSLAWKMDPAVIKYDSFGSQVWSYTYNGPSSLDDRLEGFGIDNDGNIFVVGYTQIQTGSPGREDYLIIKLLPTGDTAWVRTLPSGNQLNDRLYDIAFDSGNNIYAAGAHNNGLDNDLFLVKYNQSGDTLWTRYFDGPLAGNDLPVGVGVDDSGYVYIGGSATNSTRDFLAVKYDSNGNLIWATAHDGNGGDTDNPKDMTVDGAGNVYIIGETSDSGQRDIMVARFDNTGALAFNFQYDAGGNADEIVFAHKDLIKADDAGNVYFGGATYYVPSGLTLTNTLTFKLDSAGNIVWYNRYGGPGLDFDQIRAVYLDPNGNCYSTGYSEGLDGNWDLFLLKFSGGPVQGGCDYVVGDINNSNTLNGLDVTYAVGYLKGGPAPPYDCECTPGNTWFVSGDVNGSCTFNGLDVTYLVAYFKGGSVPIPCGDCPPSGR